LLKTTRTPRQVHDISIHSNDGGISKNDNTRLISRGKSFNKERKGVPDALKNAGAETGDFGVGEPYGSMPHENPEKGKKVRAKLYSKDYGVDLDKRTGKMVGRVKTLREFLEEAAKRRLKFARVYHGTSKSNADKIKSGGFKDSEHGVYGSGVYSSTSRNVARRYSYESDEDKNSVFIKENIQHIYDNLSTVARDVFGFQLYKKTCKYGKEGDIILNKVNMCQIYSILAILRDFDGQLRLYKDTNNFPSNYFIKRYVLCMTPFHFRGGVARSNLYYHGTMNWIIKKANQEHGLDLKRKTSIIDEDGKKAEKVIRRGHFTAQEDAVFVAYRKQYCKSIFELVNFFKQHLIS
jgi:hypothetical protein